MLALALLLLQQADEILPRDAIAYVSVTGLEKAPDAVRSVIRHYAAEAEGDGLFDEVRALATSLTGSLGGNFEELEGTITEIHLVLRGSLEGHYSDSILLIRANADRLKRYVESEVATRAGKTENQGGRPLYTVGLPDLFTRAVAEVAPELFPPGVRASPTDYFVGQHGDWLVASPSSAEARATLNRCGQADKGTSLAANPLYGGLPDAEKNRLELRSFTDGRAFWSSIIMNRRMERWIFDLVDAAFGVGQVQHETLVAWIEEGFVRGRHHVTLAGGWTALDLVNENVDEFCTLGFVPPDALGGSATRLRDLAPHYERILNAVSRLGIDPIYGKRNIDGTLFTKAWKKRYHFDFADLSGLEAGAVVSFDPTEDFRSQGENLMGGGRGLLLAVNPGPSSKLKTALEEARTSGKMVEREVEGVKLWEAEDKSKSAFCFSINDDAVLFGRGPSALENGIRAHGAKTSLFSMREAKSLRDRLPASGFHISAVSVPKVVKLIEDDYGTKTTYARRLKPDGLEMVLLSSTKDGFTIESAGAGFSLATWNVTGACGLFCLKEFLLPILMYLSMMTSDPREDRQTPLPPRLAGDPDYTPPTGAPELAAAIESLVRDLGSDQIELRDRAVSRLARIGRPCAASVAAAARGGDPEVKQRAEQVIIGMAAFDVMPELAERGVAEALASFKEKKKPARLAAWLGGFENRPVPFYVEPRDVDSARPFAGLAASEAGVLALVKIVMDPLEPFQRRDAAVTLLVFCDSAAAGDLIVKGHDSVDQGLAKDDVGLGQWLKLRFLVAAGWAPGERARKIVLDALSSDREGDRRAAFLAAERRSDPETVDKLLDLLDAADPETRWNAGFTLRSLTAGKIDVNGHTVEADRKVAAEKARAWWKDNRATFKLVRATPLKD